MSTKLTRLEQEAAALGLTGKAPASAPVPMSAPVGRTDKMLLAGASCALAALSAAASVWLVVPVLVVSGLLATMLVHALNAAARRNASGAPHGENEFDPLAGDEPDPTSKVVEFNTSPIYHSFIGNAWHDILQ